jgi:uncharacterized protein (DUF885 family)
VPADGYRDVTASALDLRWQLDPVAATMAGVETHDSRLGRFTCPDVRSAVAAIRSVAGALEAVTATALEDLVDQTALLNDLRCQVARLEQERPHELNPEFHLSHLLGGLFALLVRRDRPAAARARALAGRLAETPRFLDDARATLERPPEVFTQTALEVARGGRLLLTEAIPAFAATLPAAERAAVEEHLPAAREALRDFHDFLAGELADRSDGDFAIGRDAFEFRLHFEHALREGAGEILRYGERLCEEVEHEVQAAAGALAPGTPWRELADRLRDDHPAKDEVVGAYAAAMKQSREFVAARGLVTVPDGALEVMATPRWMRPLIPFAAYDPPGAFSPSRTGYFYVTEPEGDGARDHCVHEISCTALHEGYPGHHLHFLHATRQSSPVRRVIVSPLTVEGWALYCEELMAAEGFLARAEERFFQRLHLLWRAVRIVLDVKLHTGAMSAAEAVRHMAATLGISAQSAEAEVRRYCGAPAYQLCYAVGRRELLALREDFRKRAGAAYDARRFHDELLAWGGLPVSLIRWGMGM